ncbi:hypothetical protein Tco_0305441 [Tanacetum coccineum]
MTPHQKSESALNFPYLLYTLYLHSGDDTERLKTPDVLDQNVEEEVKDVGFVAMEEIKIIKSYQASTISGSLFIHQSSSYDQDVIGITPKDAKEGDAFESLSGLRSMHDDDLASMSGFETQDSADHVSKEGTKTLHAFADKPAQSDPFGHLHAELGTLNTKIDQLESNISKMIAKDMKSFIPAIVADTLKEQLSGLLSDAMKDTLPQLIKDFIKSSISASIAEELPQVEAQVQKNLHDQLPNILLKPMYKEFNAFNKLESQRFVLLQEEMSKSLHNKIRKSINLKDLRIMFKDMVSLLEAAEVFKKVNAEGEKGEKNNPAEEKDGQHLHQTKGEQNSGANIVDIVQGEQPLAQVIPNEEKALVVNNPEEKKSEGIVSMEDDSDEDDLDKQPLSK